MFGRGSGWKGSREPSRALEMLFSKDRDRLYFHNKVSTILPSFRRSAKKFHLIHCRLQPLGNAIRGPELT
jgi:hypothetical protein